MIKARNRHTNNTVIGAGECFIEILGPEETGEGERYLGDTPSGVLQIETEETTVVAGDGPTPRTLAQVVSNIRRSFEVSLQDISTDNLALFVLGTPGEHTIAATPVTRAKGRLTVKKGHWYQLGGSIDKLAGGELKVTSCSVHSGPSGGTPYTPSTFLTADKEQVDEVHDYTLNENAGRLYIEPSGSIADGAEICVAYTPVQQTLKTVVASARKQIKAAFRYVEDAAQGRGNNYYAPVALIRPGGDMALKDRTAAQSLTLNIEVLQPADGALAPLYINRQPA